MWRIPFIMELETIKLPSIKKYEIEWEGIKFFIENVDGNLNILFDGNINIGVSGELGLVSSDNMSIDTIGSKLYLNSRKANQIKDLPESIEYKKQQTEILKKKQLMIAHEHENFMERIEKMEQEIKELKCQ